MVIIPKRTYGGGNKKTSRKKKTPRRSKKRLTKPEILPEVNLVFDPEITLDDDIWKDSFDKFIDCKTPLRQENILKQDIRASFNRDSSIELSEYAQKLLEKKRCVREKEVKKKLSKLKPGCSKRNVSNLIVSTPINVRESEVLDVSCSPIAAVRRQRLFFPGENMYDSKSRPLKTFEYPSELEIPQINISEEICNASNNSRHKEKSMHEKSQTVIVLEPSLERTSKAKSIEHRKSRRRDKPGDSTKSFYQSSKSSNLPVICEDSISSKLSMLSISENEKEIDLTQVEANGSPSGEKSLPLFGTNNEMLDGNIVFKEINMNLDINKLRIGNNGIVEMTAARRASNEVYSNSSCGTFSSIGINNGPLLNGIENIAMLAVNGSDSASCSLWEKTSKENKDTDIYNIILKNMPKYSAKNKRNALRLKSKSKFQKDNGQKIRLESNNGNDQKVASSRISVRKKTGKVSEKPVTDLNPKKVIEPSRKIKKSKKEMNKIPNNTSNSMQIINLRTRSKRILGKSKSACFCCDSDLKISSENGSRVEHSITAKGRSFKKKNTTKKTVPAKRKDLNIIIKKIERSTKKMPLDRRSKCELRKESFISLVDDAQITRLDNIRVQENKSNSEDSGYRTSPVNVEMDNYNNIISEEGTSRISGYKKTQVIITATDSEKRHTKRQNSVTLRKSNMTQKMNIRQKGNKNPKLIEEKSHTRKKMPERQQTISIDDSSKSIDELSESNNVLGTRKRMPEMGQTTPSTNASESIDKAESNYGLSPRNKKTKDTKRKERKIKSAVQLERKETASKKRVPITTSKKLKNKQLNTKTNKVARMLLYNSVHNTSESSLLCNISRTRRTCGTSINAKSVKNKLSEEIPCNPIVILDKNLPNEQQNIERRNYINRRNLKSQKTIGNKIRNRKRIIDIDSTLETSVHNQSNQSIPNTSNEGRKMSSKILSRRDTLQSNSNENSSNTIGDFNSNSPKGQFNQETDIANQAVQVTEPEVHLTSDIPAYSTYITLRNSKSGNQRRTTKLKNNENFHLPLICSVQLEDIYKTSDKINKQSRNLLTRKNTLFQSDSVQIISNTISDYNLTSVEEKSSQETDFAVNPAVQITETEEHLILDIQTRSKFITFRNSKSGNQRRTTELKNSENGHVPIVQQTINRSSLSIQKENQDGFEIHTRTSLTATKKRKSKQKQIERAKKSLSKHNPICTDIRNSLETCNESSDNLAGINTGNKRLGSNDIDSTNGDKSLRSVNKQINGSMENIDILEEDDQFSKDRNISREVLTVIFGEEYVELLNSTHNTSKFKNTAEVEEQETDPINPIHVSVEKSEATNPGINSVNNQKDNQYNLDEPGNIENVIEKPTKNHIGKKRNKNTKHDALMKCNKILKVRVKRLKLDNINLKVVKPVNHISSLENQEINDNLQNNNNKTTKTICDKILKVRIKRLKLSDIKGKTASVSAINNIPATLTNNGPFKPPRMIRKQKQNLSNSIRNTTILEPIHEEEPPSLQTVINPEPVAVRNTSTILNESINRSEFLNSILENTKSFVANRSKTLSLKNSLHENSSNSFEKSLSRRKDNVAALEGRWSKYQKAREELLSETINESIVLRPGKWRKSLSLWKRNQSILDNTTVSGHNLTSTSCRNHHLSINRTLMPVPETKITELQDNQNSLSSSRRSHSQKNQNKSGSNGLHQQSELLKSTLERSLNNVSNNGRLLSSSSSNPLLLEPTDDGTPNLPAISLLDNSPVGRKLQQSISSKYIGNNRVIALDCDNSKNQSNFDESSNERRHTYQQQLSLSLYRQSLLPARRRRTSVLEGSYQGIVDVLQQGDGDIPFIPSEYVRIQRKSVISKLLDHRSIVLRRCGQTEPSDFSTIYSEVSLRHCRKIGEGVYGEVFMNKTASGEAIVLKIIPIEGLIEVNGEPQKKFDEILSEIVIAMELSRLRHDKEFMTGGFVDVKKVRCVQGRYPEHLIDLWELYRDNCGTENDHPEIFPEDQMYIVLELANGGQDLEAFTFQNALQSNSAFVQTALTLAVAEGKFQFEHRDLHWGNILLSVTDEKEVVFKIKGKEVRIPTHGVKATIIDYTLSRMVFDGYNHYNDLSNDDELFSATGDYQFEIYRHMKEALKNNWQIYEPYTNILWLHYTIDKMINGVRYRCSKNKKHRSAIDDMMQLRDELLDYKSASAYVECLT